MEEDLISIIVPVYNCEKYLRQCIESIINQTYRNLEIILVDDGSTDLSGEICDEYAHRDGRITVIHQENRGSQAARSSGIEIAKGLYMGFVDSDDWIDNEMYKKLYSHMDTADFVTSGIWTYDKNGKKNKYMDLMEPGRYEGNSERFCENLIISSKQNQNGLVGGILNNVYSKLFKSAIVKKCYLTANVGIRNGEDLLFVLIYALMCDEIVITNECCYHYRFNSLSVSNSKDMNYLAGMNRFYQVLDQVIVGHAMEQNLRKQLNRVLLYYVYSCTSSMMQMDRDVFFPQYVFPCNSIIEKKNIVLFGAGRVGQSYYNDWKVNHRVNIVQWIDNLSSTDEMLGQKILKPEKILQSDCDYVVCAVLSYERAEEMKKQLISLGIQECKILWEPPTNIFREFYISRND